MQIDCVYGFGFAVYASDECLRDFIDKHKETLENELGEEGRRTIQYFYDHPDDTFNPKEDLYDYTGLYSNEGFYGMIADVMTKETGIRFEYRIPQDEDYDETIIFPETYPWLLNDTEKELTEDKLRNICQKYIDDLGGQLIADYIRMEYFG